ncbi:hypothetical protein FVER53590_28834 [Fusarium verticillioides]|nr:hypothetical protein FVER53263_20027 [Fusarium verticillioides]RBR17037.1 hypothetical protein FVER53590_28834 [Fusarium verticillioides]
MEDEEETKKGRKRSMKKGNKVCPEKKKKIMTSLPRRVFYMLRVERRLEKARFCLTQAEEIDFLSDDCTKFSGVAYEFPYVGGNVEFSG